MAKVKKIRKRGIFNGHQGIKTVFERQYWRHHIPRGFRQVWMDLEYNCNWSWNV